MTSFQGYASDTENEESMLNQCAHFFSKFMNTWHGIQHGRPIQNQV